MLVISFNSQERRLSIPKVTSINKTTTERTMPVCFIVLPKVGHETFLSSEIVSLVLDFFGSFFAFKRVIPKCRSPPTINLDFKKI